MSSYTLPEVAQRPDALEKTVYTVASGDLRLAANVNCWPTQQRLEADFSAAVRRLGLGVQRGHGIDPVTGHGFIDSQRVGIDVFTNIPSTAPLVVVEAVWQYSHHVLAGLRTHGGPILVVANWAGDFPGLVGLLNLTASLTKAGVKYSALWSKDFNDDWAIDVLKAWLTTGELVHNTDHVRKLPALPASSPEVELGVALAQQLKKLRDRGVLIVGSGNIVHNLQQMQRGAAGHQAFDWALEFDQTVGGYIQQGNLAPLQNFQKLGQVAKMAHPTHEHFLPLLYAAGAVDSKERVRFFNTSFQLGSISMRSVLWG